MFRIQALGLFVEGNRFGEAHLELLLPLVLFRGLGFRVL